VTEVRVGAWYPPKLPPKWWRGFDLLWVTPDTNDWKWLFTVRLYWRTWLVGFWWAPATSVMFGQRGEFAQVAVDVGPLQVSVGWQRQ
jgi:hypothetical protein